MNKYVKYWSDKCKSANTNIFASFTHRKDKVEIHELISVIKMLGVSNILDFGSGTGTVAHELLKEYSGRYIAVDVTQSMIDIFERKNGFRPFLMNKQIPFKNERFQLVFCVSVLMHIDPVDIIDTVKELKRATSKYILIIECASSKKKLAPMNYIHDYPALFGKPTLEINFRNRTLYLFEK